MIPKSIVTPLAFAIFSLPLWLHATDSTLDSGFVSTISPGLTPDGYVPPPASPNWLSGTGAVNAVALQSDGKIIAGGNLSRYKAPLTGSPQTSLKRLNPDGSLDTSLSFNTFAATLADTQGQTEVNKILTVADDKLYVGGVFTSYDGFARSGVMRLNADGSLDTAFNTSGISNSNAFGNRYVLALAEQADGKLLVGGFFNRAGGVFRSSLARFGADGILDNSFNPSPAIPVDASVQDLAILPNGKILVAGGKPRAGGGYIPLLVLLNPDGSLDPSVSTPFADEFGDIDELLVLPDGRIIIGGDFTFVGSGTNYNIAGLQTNGALDSIFMTNLGSGPNGWVGGELVLQPDGTILAGGIFTSWNNQPRASIARLNPDGTLDPALAVLPYVGTPAVGYSSHFYSFAVQPDGKVVVGGWFPRVSDPAVETYNLTRIVNEFATGPGTLRALSPAVTTTENAGSIALFVSRFGGLIGAVSVNYTLTPLTAISGTDYTPVSGTLTWATGVGGIQSITVPILQDTAQDGLRTFQFTLSNPTGGATVPTANATTLVGIRDDDAPPVIVLEPVAVSLDQGANFSLVVLYDSVLPATVKWQRDSGSGFTDISGATSLVYTVAGANPASHAGSYRAIVTNANGSDTSLAVTVTVIPAAAVPEPGISISGVTTPSTFALLTGGSLLMLDGATFNLRKLDATFAVDPSFTVTTTPDSGFTASSASPTPIPLPNGQFLATGFFSHINGVSRKRLARLNADGTLDTAFVPFFNSGTFPVNSFTANYNGLSGVHVGASGTVYALVRSSNQGNRLFRLLPSGTADPTFSIAFDYSTNANLTSLAELTDGSILIGYTAGGTFERGIRKVLPNGTFDPTFPRFSTSSNVASIVLLGGDRFAAIHGNLLTIHNLANGSLLETHTFTGTLTSIQPYRGRLLLTGPTAFNGTPLPGFALFVLNGTVDPKFPGGAGPNANVVQSAIDTQGRIIVRGSFTTWNGIFTRGFARLIFDRPEVGFAINAASPIENTGPFNIELVRFGNTTEAASVRLTTLASTATAPADFTALDQVVTWATGDATPKTVPLNLIDDALLEGNESLTLQLSAAANSTIIPGGLAVTIRDDDSLPKITTQPVEAFAVLGKPTSFSVTATSPTTLSYQWFLNGSIINGATAASYSLAAVSAPNEGLYTVRLTNGYGFIFSTFVNLKIIPDPAALAPGFGSLALNSNVVALDVAPDGGAVIVGFFTDVGGNPNIDNIAKINANGTLDTSFIPAVITGGSLFDVALQPDGKVVIVGSFSTVGGQSKRGMVRLNANGSLDTDFAANIGSGSNGNAYAVDLMPDGSIVCGGEFTSWNGQSVGSYGAARVSSVGTFSGAFSASDSRTINAIKALPDGGVLISVNTTSTSAAKVRRYDSNFQQQAFNYATGRTRVDSIDLAADGDYLFAGNGQVLKINPDGSTDQSAVLTSATEIAAQTNGKYLAGGGPGAGRNIRYLANGTLDPNYDEGTGFNNNVNDIGVRSDGKIWFGGVFTSYKGTPVNYLALLNGDPIPLALTIQPKPLTVVDPGVNVILSVGATGTTTLSYQWFRGNIPLSDQPGISGSQTNTLTLSTVDAADAGNYIAVVTNEAGTRTSNVAQVVVLGAPEILSLSGNVSLLEGSPLTLTVQASGASTLGYQWFKGTAPLPLQTSATLSIPSISVSDAGTYSVVVTNTINSTPSAAILVTIRSNSALVATGFTPPTVTGGPVNQILALPGGRVLVGGNFTSISDGTNTSGARLAVVDEAGAVIPVAGLSADGVVESVRLQSDGKILIAGSFNNIGATPRGKLARLNTNLTLDPIFNPPGLIGAFTSASDLAQEAGGTLIAVGSFTDFGGEPTADYAVRLDDNGTYNNTFTSGSNSFIYRVFPQPDGDLIFTGWFTAWAATTEQFVVRTTAAGVVDPATDYNVGFYNCNDAFQLANGDLLAAYAFGNGTIRLSPTGTTISPFPVGGGIFGIVRAFAESPTGDLVIGGAITNAAGQPASRVILLNPDNTRDLDFNTGTGFNGNVNDVAVAPSGRIWVGGEFTTYRGIPATYLTLLKGEAVIAADPLASFLAGANVPANLRGPNDDPDGDNLSNLLEYALDLNPNGTGGAFTGTLPTTLQSPTLLSYTYRRVRNDVTYLVETSPTLIGGTWTSVGVTQGTPAGNGTTTASIPVAPGSLFLRLSVTR